jgi:hypothetical protein
MPIDLGPAGLADWQGHRRVGDGQRERWRWYRHLFTSSAPLTSGAAARHLVEHREGPGPVPAKLGSSTWK